MIKIDNLWTSKFQALGDQIAELNKMTINRFQTNELSTNVESFSKTLTEFELNQSLTTRYQTYETSLMQKTRRIPVIHN
jgi:hypothetical protein